MRRFLFIGAVSVVAIATGTAEAADLGVRPAYKAAPIAAPVPVFSWTGCYVGGHIGGGWGRETVSSPGLAPGVSVSGDTSGVLGGGQVGCNYQFASNWLIGIEGDGSAADLKGSITDTVFGITGTANAKTEWLASRPDRVDVGPMAHLRKGWSGVGRRQIFC